MAVKVFCSACDAFIKDVDIQELQKLTGKEKCTDCGKKIQELYQFLDARIAKFNTDIENSVSQAKKKFGTLDAAHNKFYSDGQSFYKTTRAEIDSHLQSILEGKKAE